MANFLMHFLRAGDGSCDFAAQSLAKPAAKPVLGNLESVFGHMELGGTNGKGYGVEFSGQGGFQFRKDVGF